jgi:N6-adenosine-specific RNA methylase IME4
VNWPFGNIPRGIARALLIDVPWHFKSNSVALPGRNAMRHYDCMSPADVSDLPVGELAAKDCALFLWITGPMLAIGAHLPLMKRWGFKPSGMGFVWVKLRPKAPPEFVIKDLAWGGGFTTRKNAEFVLIGKRGRSVRRSASVHEIVISPRREHSRKPDEVHRRIEQYTTGPYVELFARQRRKDWESWGLELDKFAETDHNAA